MRKTIIATAIVLGGIYLIVRKTARDIISDITCQYDNVNFDIENPED